MASGMGRLSGFVDQHKMAMVAVGGAMVSVGGASIALVEKYQELNTQLTRTGVNLGLNKSQMQDLANSTANAGFPLQEVADTFDVLVRAGIDNVDTLKASASAFDVLADATGGSADSLAETLVPAFKALGMEIPTTSAEMDSLT